MKIEELKELLREIEKKTKPLNIQVENRNISSNHVFKNHIQLGSSESLDEDTILSNKYTIGKKDKNGDYDIATEGFITALETIKDDARVSGIIVYINSSIQEITKEQTKFILQNVYDYVDFWEEYEEWENELVEKYQLD